MLKTLLVVTGLAGAAGWFTNGDGRIASLVAKPGVHISGAAHAIPLGSDSMRFTIAVQGAPARSEIPWAVHEGSCGNLGGIHGDADAYPPLVTDFTGETFERAVLTRPLGDGKAYAVVVYRLEELSEVAACGDFKP